jgi:hypothetical protein
METDFEWSLLNKKDKAGRDGFPVPHQLPKEGGCGLPTL